MNQNSNFERLEKKIFPFLMALFAFSMLNAIVVGYDVISSYKENYSQVEYASETNERFYQEMVKMKKNTTRFFNGFPTCLTNILHSHTQPGDEILATEKDTVYYVLRDLNRTDINKYPFYVVKDNHNNLWSLFRHNDKFHLTRENETKFKKLLEINSTTN